MKRIKTLGVLLMLGVIFLTGCDLKQNKSEEKVTNEVKKVEKKDITDTELAKKLHQQLISNDNSVGPYFNDKVSVNDANSAELIKVSIKKYLEDNNIDYTEYLKMPGASLDDGSDLYKIKKSDLSSFMNKKYDTTINYDIPNSNNKLIINLESITDIYSLDNDWVLHLGSRGGGPTEIYSKIIKAEEKKNKIVIYDKVIVNYTEAGFNGYFKSITDVDEEVSAGEKSLYWCIPSYAQSSDTKYSICNEEEKSENLFEKYKDQLNTYKHTFKKGSDGEYYWVSSEIEK